MTTYVSDLPVRQFTSATLCILTQWISGESQLAYDVFWNVTRNIVSNLGLTLYCFQHLVEFFGIKFLFIKTEIFQSK